MKMNDAANDNEAFKIVKVFVAHAASAQFPLIVDLLLSWGHRINHLYFFKRENSPIDTRIIATWSIVMKSGANIKALTVFSECFLGNSVLPHSVTPHTPTCAFRIYYTCAVMIIEIWPLKYKQRIKADFQRSIK